MGIDAPTRQGMLMLQQGKQYPKSSQQRQSDFQHQSLVRRPLEDTLESEDEIGRELRKLEMNLPLDSDDDSSNETPHPSHCQSQNPQTVKCSTLSQEAEFLPPSDNESDQHTCAKGKGKGKGNAKGKGKGKVNSGGARAPPSGTPACRVNGAQLPALPKKQVGSRLVKEDSHKSKDVHTFMLLDLNDPDKRICKFCMDLVKEGKILKLHTFARSTGTNPVHNHLQKHMDIWVKVCDTMKIQISGKHPKAADDHHAKHGLPQMKDL
ncbi:hypothetical protein AAF712_002527 [Marasmius tenuissimus]|uniref:BED-type domain-containing protein n=1 Tax=Marasmius tenuissimus TaxID=585030 RepID=A0ABR3AAH0_9AGAR